MSTVGTTSSIMSPAGAGRTTVQIAVPNQPVQAKTSDIALEAAVQRVATLLYVHSRFDVPPHIVDMGGGLFDVVV